ncbi:MAG: DUF2934 domain-containing protein [Limimaricola sp.]|uniref:DUF2934 domain-containing protein n=1 Tax=Limimaricola sp. TaxID=2211665 RepID=UPI001DDEEB84|nr:DUF2934 domain-containing protein [Limimaricola sp.]MBI1418522.1 DUF2934 domain-containing protein [Limimaricola sp.]
MAPGKSDEDKIRETAYQIWEAEGRPQGRDYHHWLAAEARFRAEAASKPKTAVKLDGPAKAAKPRAAKATAKPKAAPKAAKEPAKPAATRRRKAAEK